MSLPKTLLAQLASTREDWVRVETMSLLAGRSPDEVQEALMQLGDLVRQPIGKQGDEEHYWRLSNRGLTRGEKLRKIKALIGRYDVNEGK